MFSKILIANRGEIAQRLITAAQELGVKTVVVYSEADAGAPWVLAADEAYGLLGVTASETYLDQEKILDIAQACGAEGIHPGYGFLSENAGFAANCASRGIKFIGPSVDAMAVMGSKARARDVAVAVGVPVTPGVDGAGKSDAELAEAAVEIGYPVLIKASAGGGGKGMRVVGDPAEFLDALQVARSEAANSFGDDHIILEKFFTRIHHIEIQVLGDEYGHVIHCFERECSIQRRHQKIIEETPSPTIPHEVRLEMAQAAVTLAQAVNYASAGTVEFMYTGGGKFYLLEMNTRLQVEHPITELVTGLDLVQWQIRIASGERLSLTQADLSQRGHAIECRVYAENPAQNFLPSIGTLSHCSFPVMPHVRIDSGIVAGSAVTPYYDPMLAKVVVWGGTRRDAIARMVNALKRTVLLGVTHNIPYLLAILQESHFQAGETTTHYLADYFADWAEPAVWDDELALAIAAFELLDHGMSDMLTTGDAVMVKPDPWQNPTRWRNV